MTLEVGDGDEELPAGRENAVDLAMVILAEPTAVPAPALSAALTELGGGKLDAVEEEDGTMTFTIGEAIGTVALMPVPIPWSDLEGPAESAFMWREAAAVLRPHRAHLLVSLIGQTGSPVERKLRLTRLAAAVAQVTQALGVYWGDGPAVHSRELFVRKISRSSRWSSRLPRAWSA